MEFKIKPIHKQFACNIPMTEAQTHPFMTLCLKDEVDLPCDPIPGQGLHTIVENALVLNGCTAHPFMIALISMSVYGNPGAAQGIVYSLARTAFTHRVSHIDKNVFTDTFPMGLPSNDQCQDYWDIYKNAARDAQVNETEFLFRPCLMLNALRAANVSLTDKDDDQIRAAYLELDDTATDENYALPAD